MDAIERTESEEIDGDTWIALVFRRRWPKYLIAWSVRRRSGDTDFPVASGEVESMQASTGESADDVWDKLRRRALEDARRAAESAPRARRSNSKSPLSRLFGR